LQYSQSGFAFGIKNRCNALRIAGTVTRGSASLFVPGDAGASFWRTCSNVTNPYANITKQAW